MSNEDAKYNFSEWGKLKSQNAGFQVPSEYLEELEDRILLQVKGVSNTGKQGFTIPENYFENTEKKALSKVKNSPNRTLFYLKRGMAAAVVLLFVSLGIRQFSGTSTSVDVKDMNAWMESGVVDVSDYDLAMIYEAEFQQVALTDFVDQTEIESYLINNVNDLLEQ